MVISILSHTVVVMLKYQPIAIMHRLKYKRSILFEVLKYSMIWMCRCMPNVNVDRVTTGLIDVKGIAKIKPFR